MARNKLIHIHSVEQNTAKTGPKVPTSTTLEYGEIAVNYLKDNERLFIRNSNNSVVEFFNSSAFRYGCTNVTSLTNVPIKTRLVYASLSEDQSLTVDTSSFPSIFEGVSMKIIAYNNSANNITIVFPCNNDNYKCFVQLLTVNSGEYAVIDIDFKSSTEVYFDGKVEAQQSGYTGDYGIVAFSNGTDYQFIKDKDSNLSDFKTAHSDYDPIGIVVIPASCSNIVYTEGDVRRGKNIIMSLAPMNYTTPDKGGSSNQYIYWGGYGTDTSLTNFNVVNYYSDGLSSQTTISTTEWGRIPSDAFSGTASKAYPSIKYYSTSESYPIPSPFKSIDGELVPNEEYYTTSKSSLNALSDFAGPSNTKVLIDLATAQTDWKTVDTAISNSNSANYYPAACCCARYGGPANEKAPKGTSSFLKACSETSDFTKGIVGVWYMPACGELGFIVPHRSKNDTTISNVAKLYTSSGNIVSLGSNFFWSSSEYSSDIARSVSTSSGGVGNGYGYKNGYYYVRAFCAVG